MASRLVTGLIVALAERIAARIRRGKLWPTLAAALVGAGIGALAGLATVYLLAAGTLLGARSAPCFSSGENEDISIEVRQAQPETTCPFLAYHVNR